MVHIARNALSCYVSVENNPEFSFGKHNASVVTVYNNIEDHRDCKNYRGVSFLDNASKIFARIDLNTQKIVVNRVYSESRRRFMDGSFYESNIHYIIRKT